MGTRSLHPLLSMTDRIRRTPAIWTVHGYLPFELQLNKPLGRTSTWVVNAEFRFLVRSFDKLLGFSDYTRQLLLKHVPSDEIQMMSLGVDLRKLRRERGTITRDGCLRIGRNKEEC